MLTNMQEFGFWEPRNGIELSTSPDKYPTWSCNAQLASGHSVEYKYVVIRADGAVQWEANIDNRMFTSEGTVLVLDDGSFNEESAMLLNKDFASVQPEKKRLIGDAEVAIEGADTIYVMTLRLPVLKSS